MAHVMNDRYVLIVSEDGEGMVNVLTGYDPHMWDESTHEFTPGYHNQLFVGTIPEFVDWMEKASKAVPFASRVYGR